MLENQHVGFIGFGNMAQAMADGWLRAEAIPSDHMHACAAHFDSLVERTSARGMQAHATAAELIDAVDVVVVANKTPCY